MVRPHSPNESRASDFKPTRAIREKGLGLEMANESHINIPEDALHPQTMKALAAEGITTLQRLAELSATELLGLHRIGRKGVVAIASLLNSHGLELKGCRVIPSSALHRDIRAVLTPHISQEIDLVRAIDDVVACVERYWNSSHEKSTRSKE